MEVTLAAQIFIGLASIVVLFQLALAAGAPWGGVAFGGKFPGRLPNRVRVVSVFSALLLVGFALIVGARAGLLLPSWKPATQVLVWFVTGYCVLGTLANAITPSRWERIIWLPVVLALLATSLVVATS